MKKLPIALFCLVMFAAAPLWAADANSEAHIFQFDYDNQLETPLLSQEPEAAPVPLAAEQSTVTAPPAGGYGPGFVPPPPLTTAEPAPSSLDELFSPPPVEEPKTAVQNSPAQPAAKKAARVPNGPEKIQVTRSKPEPPKAAAKASPAKAKTGAASKAAAPKRETAFIQDPRFRLWFLASLTWNKPRSGYLYGGADSLYKRQPIDLKEFPRAASLAQARVM